MNIRLTNDMRGAFIRRAMHDVPSIDYETQIRDRANRIALSLLPPAIAALLNDEATEPYVSTVSFYLQVAPTGMSCYGLPGHDSEALQTKIEEGVAALIEAWNEQRRVHNDLR